MCGICGIVNTDAEHQVLEAELRNMIGLLRHRGPDGEGVHIGNRIGLGHTRLSIIDLAHGGQPMTNEDGSIWLTYNGEIFNFPELRRELIQQGHTFRTNCDTEVVVHAYEEYGPDCVLKFNGMFSFALWDERNETLFMARDRLGVKPLYYTMVGHSFIFASEIKAILSHPSVTAEVREGAVPEYLFCTVLLEGQTMFKNIHSLPPGYTLSVQGTKLTAARYWSMKADAGGERSLDAWKDETLSLLTDSVWKRRMSDIPFGSLLSGGLDSSLLTALAVSGGSDSRLRTFSMEYGDNRDVSASNSDTAYARLMAEHLGTDHREFIFRTEDYRDMMEKVTWHMEKPVELTTPSLYLLYREIKKEVSVVISGEGADELFGGYFFFLNGDPSGQVSQFPWAPYYREVSGLLDQAVGERTGFRDKVESSLRDSLRQFPSRDPLNRILYLFMKYYLLEMLERQDKTSMASGVEVRVPFLDYRIVERVINLPSQYKLKDGSEKWFLKEIGKSILPSAITDRKKKPFPFPVDPKSVIAQRQLASDLIRSGNSKISAYFDKRKTIDFLNKRGDYAGLDNLAVFRTSHALIALELWHKTFGV
ncbi:asparagine synthase (glutamine-hydrolyzing) [Paenibacillus durus]|uniref:asparagine synthase (glutamine-hydrolyzing) n=2 Tax=Paenibacillus durus TaxID=44251 RepID=A0A0F7CJ06_PAEDU|nr:asparagine synthase (glutamine-hydrolyzing) [Paenibacillus durus]AKG35130.1 asparagine synthase [Paenibacillus durus ATCC 35681]